VAAKRQQLSVAAEVSDAEIERYFGFARQIATATAFLHARGGLHLDQKPANVVLFSTAATATAAGKTQLANVDLATLNVAKIVDLGLAVLSRKELDQLEEGFGGDGTHALTHVTATSVGATMAYASPEQAHAGADTKLRPTMDVYSFGAILYRLLCVSRPHANRSAFQILQHKLFDDAMNEDNLLPAFRAANSARTAAAKQLVAVMRMCLEHEPAKRPQTGTDVLHLLLRDGEELPAELVAAAAASTSDVVVAIENVRAGGSGSAVLSDSEVSGSHGIAGVTLSSRQ
jgi:serine/threonine protein kinase